MPAKKNLLPILYEDDWMMAINKPPYVGSVPSPTTPVSKSISGRLTKKYAETELSPFLLHRLDRDTSGVLLVGKHKKDRAELEAILRDEKTKKTYLVLVKGRPRGSSITNRIPSRTTGEPIPATTKYKVLSTFPGNIFSLVEATIETGRRHQIRRHFSMIGHPVILDGQYGDQKLNKQFRMRLRLSRHFLHARSITFVHPFTQKEMTIEAPLPPDLKSTIKKIGWPAI